MGISHSCPAQVNSCDSDDELELLVELIGTLFFRAPMLLFVWGSLIVFLEFVLYFKIHVDAGFNCSMCLASCFVLVPLFVHCMHKMGWAAAVVHAESASRRRRAAERPCAPLCANQPVSWDVGAKLENSLARSNRSRFG